MEARGQPVRRVPGVGGDRRRRGGRVPHVPPVGVRPRRTTAARGPRRRHGDAPRSPGQGGIHRTDRARPRRPPRRRGRVRVQHPQRAQPPGLPEDGLAAGSPAPGARPPGFGTVRRPDRPGADRRGEVVRRDGRRHAGGRGSRGRRRRRCPARVRAGERAADPPFVVLPRVALWLRAAPLPGRRRRRRPGGRSRHLPPAASRPGHRGGGVRGAHPPGDPAVTRRLLGLALRTSGADYAVRLGDHLPRAGFVPLPGQGPTLLCRDVCQEPSADPSTWHLGLGDVELF